MDDGTAMAYSDQEEEMSKCREERGKSRKEIHSSVLLSGTSHSTTMVTVSQEAGPKKPKRQRAAAKVDVAPIHPIFAQAAALTHDSLWKDILIKMSRNIYRKGFRYYPLITHQARGGQEVPARSSHDPSSGRKEAKKKGEEDATTGEDESVGRLTFRARSKEFDCRISPNPEEALRDVKRFMASHIGLISDAEQEEMDDSIRILSLDPLDVLPKSWEEVKTEGSRNILIRHYVDEFRKKYSLNASEYQDLMTTLQMGIASEILNESSITLKNGAIESVRGVIFDRERKEFFISTDCIFPSQPLQLRKPTGKRAAVPLPAATTTTPSNPSKQPPPHLFSSLPPFADSNKTRTTTITKEDEQKKGEEPQTKEKEGESSTVCQGRILASAVYLNAYKRCETFLVEQIMCSSAGFEKKGGGGTTNLFPPANGRIRPPSLSLADDGRMLTHLPAPQASFELLDAYVSHVVPINLGCAAAASIATAETMGNKTYLTVRSDRHPPTASAIDWSAFPREIASLECFMGGTAAADPPLQLPKSSTSKPASAEACGFSSSRFTEDEKSKHAPMTDREVAMFLEATSAYSVELVKKEMKRLDFRFRPSSYPNLLLIPVPIQRFLECLTLFGMDREGAGICGREQLQSDDKMCDGGDGEGATKNDDKMFDGAIDETAAAASTRSSNSSAKKRGGGESPPPPFSCRFGGGNPRESVWPLLVDKSTFSDPRSKTLRLAAASEYLSEMIQSVATPSFSCINNGGKAASANVSAESTAKRHKKALLFMQAASERISRSKSALFFTMIHDLMRGISNGLVIEKNTGFRISGHINPLFRIKQ